MKLLLAALIIALFCWTGYLIATNKIPPDDGDEL